MKNPKRRSANVDAESHLINRELYKRNAELAVRNKTLALLRKLDEISLRAIGVKTTAREIAAAIAIEFGYEIVAIARIKKDAPTIKWLSFASAVPKLVGVLSGLDTRAQESPLTSSIKRGAGVTSRSGKSGGSLAKGLSAAYPDSVKNAMTGARGPQISSSLVYPLVFEQQMIGVISFSAVRNLHELTKYERESIDGIVSLTSLALYKAKLFEDLQITTEQLREANKRLKELMAIKTEFLHIASHQLRTPLTSLRGYLSMQASGDFEQLTEQRRKELQKTMSLSADQLNALVNDLLKAMELEGGAPNLELKPSDVWTVVKEAIDTMQIAYDNKKLKLIAIKPSKLLPKVDADPSYLRQVFLNILDNSMKYTESGAVTVTAKRLPGSVQIAISDTGIGIDPRDMPKLFNKFVRAGNSETRHTTGSGLGLFIIKQIVEQHHGRVKLESAGVGKGTTFTVILPIAQDASY